MSKRYKMPPVNLQDYKDKLALEGSIPIDTGDRVFYMKPIELLTDDQYKALDTEEDPAVVGSWLMDDYDDFVAAGGSAQLLLKILYDYRIAEAVSAGEQGATPGESGASSES